MFSDNKKGKGSSIDSTKEQNKISQGTLITGNVEGKGGFRIEGKLEGTLKTPGKVVLGKTGFIDGEMECENADIEGKFLGKMNIKGTLTLRSTAHIEGDVTVGKLAIEPDATFNATCKMKGAVKSLKDESRSGRQEAEKTA